MAQLGSLAVSLINGEADPLKQTTNTWTVPGIDGVGIHVLGKSESDASYRCVHYVDEANRQAFMTSLAAIQSTIVQIVNSAGSTFDNQFVEQISQTQRRPGWPYADIRLSFEVRTKTTE